MVPRNATAAVLVLAAPFVEHVGPLDARLIGDVLADTAEPDEPRQTPHKVVRHVPDVLHVFVGFRRGIRLVTRPATSSALDSWTVLAGASRCSVVGTAGV
uniref:(northern house mosquito) hypothetical protein n=1 Tax=Culex pipiens TaxID=7175 RepID=A0A8D8K9F9_CULPI